MSNPQANVDETAITDANRQDHYHHGDLKAALLHAAESLLREKGVEGFTLRECARRAGVSHAAPAHHFGDSAGLLAEFAAVGFERMHARMQAYRAEATPAPFPQLRAVGQAYMDFAVANPAHFKLMFRRDKLDRTNERLKSAGALAFDQLRQALAKALNKTDINAELILAWSTVHGFATLLLDERLAPFDVGAEPETFGKTMGDSVLTNLFAGLAPGAQQER
jgi:AcrR family transcriptional regulator